MNFEIGDIITINEKKCLVLTFFTDENNKYVFVNELEDDEEEVTYLYYIVKVNEDNSFTKITDEQEMKRLFPQVQKGLQVAMDILDIDPNDFNFEG